LSSQLVFEKGREKNKPCWRFLLWYLKTREEIQYEFRTEQDSLEARYGASVHEKQVPLRPFPTKCQAGLGTDI